MKTRHSNYQGFIVVSGSLMSILALKSVNGFSPLLFAVSSSSSSSTSSSSSSSSLSSPQLKQNSFRTRLLSSLNPDDNDSDNDDNNNSSSSSNSNGVGGNENDDPLQYLKEKYLAGQQPKLPTVDTNRPNKGDIYDDNELSELLNLHNELYPQTVQKKQQQQQQQQQDPSDLIPSLHELVLQTVQGIDNEVTSSVPSDTSTTTTTTPSYPWLTESIQKKISSITAIASDVDGTIVGSDQMVHPRTKAAIIQAIQESSSPLSQLQYFFPATGKTRSGVLTSLGPELASFVAQCPGVFIQGLYCVNRDGTVVFEKKLSKNAIQAAEQLVSEYDTSIVAYDGDDLYTTKLTPPVWELHERYGEPLSTEIPSIANYENGVHKILICDHDLNKLAKIRIRLEELAKDNNATVTQAVPTMIELLPEGCSKAVGVQKLCDALGIDDPSQQLLAIGDAENDVEMLKMASIGVSVGNGCQLAKNAANVVLDETNDQGGAGLAIEILGGLNNM